MKNSFSVQMHFNGNCREAINFYGEIFNSKAKDVLTYGSMDYPEGVDLPKEWVDRISYSVLDINGSEVVFSDTPWSIGEYNLGLNLSLIVRCGKVEEVRTFVDALSAEGGTVHVPISEQMFAKPYAFLIDKFGMAWHVMGDDDVSRGEVGK